jgi:hypothetical protein
MKKILLSVLLAASIVIPSLSQSDTNGTERFDKNVLKVNLTGLLFSNYSFQYERMLSRKISLALSVRTQPKGPIPATGFVEGLIDDPETFAELERLRLGNFALTPEVRFYLGKKSGPRGFYVAPFMRYSKFQIEVADFEYAVTENVNGQDITETRTLNLNGDIKGITGGLMFGSQWRLGRSVYLDWWIIGGSFGSSSGMITVNTPLNTEEQDAIRQELNSLEIPLLDYTVEVSGTGAKMNFQGPFASLTGGLSLGIKF